MRTLHRYQPLLLVGMFSIAHGQSSFWQQTSGPHTGSIRSYFLTSNGSLLAGTNGAGIFLSSDDGLSWNSVPSGQSAVSAFERDSSGAIVCAAWTYGILRSTDEGQSWFRSDTGITDKRVLSLTKGPSGSLFAGTFGGRIYRSNDNGLNWNEVFASSGDVRSMTLNSLGYLLAATGQGMKRSTDAGTTWAPSDSGLTVSGAKSINSIAKTPDGTYFIATFGGLFKSTDQGMSWTQVSSVTLPATSVYAAPNGNIFVGVEILIRSRDGGITWDTLDTGIWRANYRAFLGPSTSLLLCGADYFGSLRTTNGGDVWTKNNLGLKAGTVLSLLSFSGKVYAATAGGLFVSSDDGSTWIQSSVGNYYIQALHTSFDNKIFVGTLGGFCFVSIDSGETWTSIPTGVSTTASIATDSSGNIFFASAIEGVLRSSDNGLNWSRVNNGIGIDTMSVRSLVIKRTGLMFLLTGQGIHRSTNAGDNWTKVMGDFLGSYANYLTITPDGDLFASTTSAVYKSSNDGSSWFGTAPSGYNIRSISFSAELWLATAGDKGILVSTNSGSTWAETSSGLSNLFVSSSSFGPFGYAYVGSSAQGVFRSENPVITTVEFSRAGLPNDFHLSQNYPNPFNSSTTFQFSIPQSRNVSLEVFNILGQRIVTLVNDYLDAGTYRGLWTAGNFTSGVYYYRLRWGEISLTRKILLIK